MKPDERVVTFSVKPEDKAGRSEIDKLRRHSVKTGISFSVLMLRAIKMLNKELSND